MRLTFKFRKCAVTIVSIVLIVGGFLLISQNLRYSWWRQKLGIYPYAGDKKAFSRGKKLYQVRCEGCHDVKMISSLKRYNENHFFIPDYYRIITYGKDAMVGFEDRLSQRERWKIVGYILNSQYQLSKETTKKAKDRSTDEHGSPHNE